MKTQSRLVVLLLFGGFFACPGFAAVDLAKPDPKLAGVDTLWLDVTVDGNIPNRPALQAKIKHQCYEQLQKTGLAVTNNPALCTWSTKSKIPVLKIRIDVFEVNDTSAFVFHARTSFAGTVSLDTESGPILYKAEVWEGKSVMESAAKDKIPEAITEAVLRQVDEFAAAWSITNSKQSEKQNVEQNAQHVAQATLRGLRQVVASKNSDVFHKPDCPFAQSISPKNIIDYNGPEDAIAAGKRPCKKCNPQ